MGEMPDETRGNRVDFPLRNGDCRAPGVGMEFSEESRRMPLQMVVMTDFLW
mgnify:CR=1 FL=1